MRGLFIIFIIVPIAEMLLLIEVSDHIGALSTIGLVVLTAAIGIQVLKQQGLSTFKRANQRMQSGELPGQEIIEGLFLAVGGAFLLTPGFITDTLGFIFLIGPSRRLLVRALIKSGKISMFTAGSASQGFAYSSHTFRQQAGMRRPGSEEGVFEGEFTEEKPENEKITEQEPNKEP